MKSFFWKAVLVFSLVLNAAVAGTLGYHLWWWYGWFRNPLHPAAPSSFSAENNRALEAPDGAPSRRELQEKRRVVIEKKGEVLDTIAAHPGDLEAIKPYLDELLQLQAQMETAALTRISKVMAKLPEEKRQQFLTALKNRACRGPGIMGRGFGHRGPKGKPMHPDRPLEPPSEN